MPREKEENDKYYRIKLKSSNGLLSIHETKELNYKEYHEISGKSTNEYQILTEVEKTFGRNINYLDISEEPYKTYEFKSITYKKINDFSLDGFEYDKERKVVFYGLICGLYAIKENGEYYDVITKDKIPREVIVSVSEMTISTELNEMLKDLELIEKRKIAYIRITRERIFNLSKGENNRLLAAKRYKQNYNKNKSKYEKKLLHSTINHLEEQQSQSTSVEREKIKQLIYRIQKNNDK